jgi:hypothetical protein
MIKHLAILTALALMLPSSAVASSPSKSGSVKQAPAKPGASKPGPKGKIPPAPPTPPCKPDKKGKSPCAGGGNDSR